MAGTAGTDAAATAAGEVCVQTPTLPACVNYTYPEALAYADLASLCHDMPFMLACSVHNACNATLLNQVAVSARWRTTCDPFALVATICVIDKMGGMSGCANYMSMCGGTGAAANASAPPQCAATRASVAGLPSSSAANEAVRGICAEMDMDGCSECTPSWRAGRRWGACDLLTVYGRLCHAMPGMSPCAAWSAMCAVDASLYACRGALIPSAADTTAAAVDANNSSSSSNSGDGDGGGAFSSGPAMKMYFFTGLPFYLLFESWTPSTPGQLALAWLAIFALGLVYEALQALQQWMALRSLEAVMARGGGGGGGGGGGKPGGKPGAKQGGRLSAAAAGDDDNDEGCPCSGGTPPSAPGTPPPPRSALRAAFSPRCLAVDLGRTALRFVTISLSYLLMLAAMSFNVAIFFAVVSGLSVGWFLFARYSFDPTAASTDDGCHNV